MYRDEVLILSGGMDSATLLWDRLSRRRTVAAITVNYGQRHAREVQAARELVQAYQNRFSGDRVEHQVVDLSDLKQVLTGSSQTDDLVSVPHGHYTDVTMQKTVVPNRNMILLSVAIAKAIACEADRVLYGAHAGDHAIYPDCRTEFIRAMADVAALCHYSPVEVFAPYQFLDKGQILVKGLELGVPYELTWTCYEGKEQACGQCGACCERLEAFAQAGVKDPLPYIAKG